MKPFRRNRGVASEGTTSSQIAAQDAARFDTGFAPLRMARARKIDARTDTPAPAPRFDARPRGDEYAPPRPSFADRPVRQGAFARPHEPSRKIDTSDSRQDRRPVAVQSDRPARAFEPLRERPQASPFQPRDDRGPARSFDTPGGDATRARSFDTPGRDAKPARTFESPLDARPARSSHEHAGKRPVRSFEPREQTARPPVRSFESREQVPRPVARTFEPKPRTEHAVPPPPAPRPVTLPSVALQTVALQKTNVENVETFEDLQLIEPLLRAIREEGHEHPTPIQAKAIPHALQGRDLFGCAQTGTGKTAAFVLPIVQKLVGSPRSGRPVLRTLVLSPTRELAVQIARSFERYARFTGIRHTVVYGGVQMGPQAFALRRGVDVLIATPGRLCDLMNQGLIDLSQIEVLVLDEADRMLDQGFQPVVSDLAKLMPKERQTLFFSATMPPSIEPFARELLRDPIRVQVSPVASTPDRVEEAVYFVDQEEKRKLLQHVLLDPAITRAMIFTRTKHAADRVARMLTDADVRADAIHGDKTQGARQRALSSFKNGRVRVLVATDVAARGIDVDGVSHVINYDLPAEAEGYVHRIGRTARAGMDGIALSFCAADERASLFRIERLIRRRVKIVDEHPFKPEGSPTNASVAERETSQRRDSRPRYDRPRGHGPS